MNLQQQIEQDLKLALKSGDKASLGALRLLWAAIQNKKIANNLPKDQLLADDEVLALIKTEVKRHKDSIEAYLQGGRQDLVDKEEFEMAVKAKYLPAMMPADEIKAVVKKVVASGEADFGKIMGQVMAELKGQADGQAVSQAVKEVLAE